MDPAGARALARRIDEGPEAWDDPPPPAATDEGALSAALAEPSSTSGVRIYLTETFRIGSGRSEVVVSRRVCRSLVRGVWQTEVLHETVQRSRLA